jgi:hypothetical protein
MTKKFMKDDKGAIYRLIFALLARPNFLTFAKFGLKQGDSGERSKVRSY